MKILRVAYCLVGIIHIGNSGGFVLKVLTKETGARISDVDPEFERFGRRAVIRYSRWGGIGERKVMEETIEW